MLYNIFGRKAFKTKDSFHKTLNSQADLKTKHISIDHKLILISIIMRH